jgi:hypothetical protein
MATSASQARAELARREIARRQSAEPEDNENLLHKVVRYGLKDPAIGILNAGREFANLPHKISGGRIPEGSPSDYDFSKLFGVEKPDSGDKLVQMLTQYGPSMALPGVGLGRAGQAITKIPRVGKLLSKAISEAIPQAGYAAAQAPQDQAKAGAEAGATQVPFSILTQLMGSTNPKARIAAKILGGGAFGLVGHHVAKGLGLGETGSEVVGLASAILGGRGMKSDKDRFNELAKHANTPLATEKMAAANRLGLDYLTPAEASESRIAASRQGGLGKTEEGEQILHQKLKGREESERRAIEATLNKIYSPEKMDKQVEEAYKSINEVNLPQDFPLQYKDNEIIKEAKNAVENTPAYKESLKALMPKNVKLKKGQADPQATSLVYWDHVKRAMDDMVNKAERAGNNNEARIISNTRRDMRDQMDAAFPEYANARALYERKIVREGLEKVFDRKAINGTNFYQALASQKKFDEVLGRLKNAPEAVQNLKDMRLVFKELLGERTIKTAKGKEEYGMNQSRSSGKFLENAFEHIFTGGKNDKKAIEFITSKDWQKQLQDINKISGKHLKLVAFLTALTKGVSQAAGEQDKKPLELNLVGGHR